MKLVVNNVRKFTILHGAEFWTAIYSFSCASLQNLWRVQFVISLLQIRVSCNVQTLNYSVDDSCIIITCKFIMRKLLL